MECLCFVKEFVVTFKVILMSLLILVRRFNTYEYDYESLLYIIIVWKKSIM